MSTTPTKFVHLSEKAAADRMHYIGRQRVYLVRDLVQGGRGPNGRITA